MAPGVRHKSISSSEIDVLALGVRKSINMTILNHSLREATGAGSTGTRLEDYRVASRPGVMYVDTIHILSLACPNLSRRYNILTERALQNIFFKV